MKTQPADRERFERWARAHGLELDLDSDQLCYDWDQTHLAWQAWCASKEHETRFDDWARAGHLLLQHGEHGYACADTRAAYAAWRAARH